MCGRFTQSYTWDPLQRFYRLTQPARNLRPRYNIRPTDQVYAVIRDDAGLLVVPMRWQLIPPWWKKPLKERPATFNARAETVPDKPMFRDAFRHTRCLIPASGYYEWEDRPDGKQPYYIAPTGWVGADHRGAVERLARPRERRKLTTCTMIITEAKSFISGINDRCPCCSTKRARRRGSQAKLVPNC